MKILIKLSKKLTYTQIIVLTFVLLIFIGTVLLMLPIASRSGTPTPPLNAMFTATSATCVTGLIIYDTFTHWSLFGQIVIISLIQIGGLGFLTLISLFFLFAKKRISARERRLLMQSEGSLKSSGVVRLLIRVIKGTVLFESTGALILATRFIPKLGVARGMYYAVFHSVSAFCNAGFDLNGRFQKFSSFTLFNDDPVILITLMALIIIGGLGFSVWSDIADHRFKIKKYSLHSKIVICANILLLAIPFILFVILENSHSLKDMNGFEKILNAAFLTVSPRTAGFNSVDLNALNPGSELLTDVLMLIGGSPGSTAGGIKTVTVFVLFLTMISTAKGTPNVEIFKKRIPEDTVRQASAIITVYLCFALFAAIVICAVEGAALPDVIFEVASAIGTVGVTKGLTQQICGISKVMIMALMFGGRVGGLSLVMFLAEKKKNVTLKRPEEKILIG